MRGVWRTHGNYGSKVFDPASDAVFLEVFVCDDCLSRKKQLIEEVVVRHTSEVVERRTPSFRSTRARSAAQGTGRPGAPGSVSP